MIHTFTHYVVVCDGCGAEHVAGLLDGAIPARIDAGMKDGWVYRAAGKRQGANNRSRQRAFDYCGKCAPDHPVAPTVLTD